MDQAGVGILFNMNRDTGLDGFGEFYVDLFAIAVVEDCSQLPCVLRNNGKCPSSPVCCLHFLVTHLQIAVQAFALCGSGFKCHMARNANNQIAAFRIKPNLRSAFLFLSAEIAHGTPKSHVTYIFPFCQRLVIYRNNATVYFIIVHKEFFCHLLVIEPLVGCCKMWPHASSPIPLPFRIGSDLIETAIHRRVCFQSKLAIPLAIIELDYLALCRVSVVIQQVYIQHIAYCGRCRRVSLPYIGLEPYCISQKE